MWLRIPRLTRSSRPILKSPASFFSPSKAAERSRFPACRITLPIPVKIGNWNVPDGLHVQTGSIDVPPKLTLAASVPALQGTIETLSGQAGGELDATLNVTLSDDTLRLPGEKPVSWSGVKA